MRRAVVRAFDNETPQRSWSRLWLREAERSELAARFADAVAAFGKGNAIEPKDLSAVRGCRDFPIINSL